MKIWTKKWTFYEKGAKWLCGAILVYLILKMFKKSDGIFEDNLYNRFFTESVVIEKSIEICSIVRPRDLSKIVRISFSLILGFSF